jgi:two-component system, chemotaxis family, chemotaxis protein CheV
MAGILDGVNQRTQLVGKNRLELLLFRLGVRQRYAINVFKVREVIPCPKLKRLPDSHPNVVGIGNMRGQTIPVIDLSSALGYKPIRDLDTAFVIITEFNRYVQGFLVTEVDRILNCNWEEIMPPPKGTERGSYLTAITNVDGELIEIVDVEKVLEEVVGSVKDVSDEIKDQVSAESDILRRVLVADDSLVARNQVKRALGQVDIECVLVNDGREALDQLKAWAKDGRLYDEISLVISDIEMPEMDGYTLASEIRNDPDLKDLYVIMHSSLSGVFNTAMVEKVGADAFLPKFKADELAMAVLDKLQNHATHESN